MKTAAFSFLLAEYQQLAHYLFRVAPKFFYAVHFSGQTLFLFTPSADLYHLLSICKRHLNLNNPIDFTAVDYPQRFSRFSLITFLRFLPCRRIFFKNVGPNFVGSLSLAFLVVCSEFTSVTSLTPLYLSLSWAEREVWDLFGVFFSNHPDLRRLLSDYGFTGHPLRKDFPLSGFLEVRYDDAFQRVVTEPLELTQEFRNFDFLNPWVAQR